MSDSSSIALYGKKEVTYATNPGGTADFRLRLTGEGLKQVTESTRSDEIDPTRQTSDIIRKGIGVAGPVNGRFSCASYDEVLRALWMAATWSAEVVTSGVNLQATAATQRFTRASGDFTATSPPHAVGMWIKTSGFTNPANNGWFKITAVAATTLDVTGPTAIVDEASAPSRTIKLGSQIVNGTQLDSFSLYRDYTDLSTTFELFKGCCFDKGVLTIPTNDMFSIVFDVLGKIATSETSAPFAVTAAGTNPILESIDHVPYFAEGPASGSPPTFVNSVAAIVDGTFELGNNLRQRLQVGTLGPLSIGKGQCDVRGAVRVYFQTAAMFNKYLAWTNTNLFFVLSDGTRSYVLDLPRVKLSDGERVAGGINQDVIAAFQYEAFKHETEGVTARLVRWTS
jgi:hypothetical protein